MSAAELEARGFRVQQIFRAGRGDRVTTRPGRLAAYLRRLGQDVVTRRRRDDRVEVWAKPGLPA